MRCDVALDGVAVEVGERDAGGGEDGHVAVGEEVDVAGVVEDAGDVGGDEVLAVADADDDGRAEAGGDDLVGLGGGEDAEGEGSGEALDGAADGVFERDGLRRRLSASFCTCSMRWAMISVSVSVTNLWPWAMSSCLRSR